MGPELIYRGHDAQPPASGAGYSPKPEKRMLWLSRALRYLLREQRLLFLLVGVAVAALVMGFAPASPAAIGGARLMMADPQSTAVRHHGRNHRVAFEATRGFVGGKVPLGLKRKGLRIVVTGGAGFVGSHLVDRLMARGDSVIVVDNFFTGRKQNVMHHFGNPNFELIRHDVVEPLLLEVDQIYHLACPASPVHYKFNPVKTIISFLSSLLFPLLRPSKFSCCFCKLRSLRSFVRFVLGCLLNPACAQDQRGGNSQHARPGQACRCQIPPHQHQRGLRRPLAAPSSGDLLGQLLDDADAPLQVEGLMRLMEGEYVGPFNLGNPGEFTMLELAKVVQETIDPNASIEFRPNTEDDPHKRKPDITRAKELLNWEPKISLRQGLPLMVSDFRNRIFGDHSDANPTGATATRSS
ncbi:hypothetical protein B296_00033912 [Ensete ventricosum]|uniref:NAD-dependent epimerase/dehydratase domain-containing protein n=1 Tax=Ensete ventricosum TaxID=4639 RepID=A0A426ZL93_ENSVE|nr:hypothetical protein B296_00033912 [Ensete ventricosum]